jgi:hypothetical protein
MRYADSVTRSFLEYSSPAWRDAYPTQKPNKYVDYQDPTYLGFYVRFPQLGVNGEGEREVADENRDFDTWPGGLLYNESHPDSAIRYLKSIGEYTRAEMVKELIQLMYQLQRMPWYMTKVSGLEEIWKIDPGQSFRGKDKKLAFELLESIDLKTTYLMDLYRKAAYDVQHMRWMLPPNLRVFDMELVITEIRSFHRPSNTAVAATNTPNATNELNEFANPIKPGPLGNVNIPGLTERGIQNAVSAVVPNSQWASGLSNALVSTLRRDPGAYSEYPVLMTDFNSAATFMNFKFSKCHFDITADAPAYFGALSKTPDTVATNKLTIVTPVIKETNTYGLLGAILRDTYDQSSRSENSRDRYFNDPGSLGSTFDANRTVLEGTKREFFENAGRLKNQQRIREQNARLNGLLGNLLGTATNIASSALNNALQGAVSRAILGNVFSDSFPLPIAEDIADKVLLEAPQLAQAIVTAVALESNGITIDGSISPATTELTGVPISSPNDTTVQFSAPIITAPSTQTVQLDGTSSNTPIASSVDLIAPVINGSGDQSVPLTGPTAGPLLSPRVNFVEPPKGQIQNGTVKLEGTTESSTLPGSVTFNTVPANNQSGDKVSLEAAESSNTNPGSVILEGEGTINGTTGSVNLLGPTINNDIENTVTLEAPSNPNINPGQIEFVEPSTNNASASNVLLTGSNASLEGTTGSVIFEGGTVSQSALTSVELTAAETKKSSPSKVLFEEPTISKSEESSVELKEAPKNSVLPTGVIFEEPQITKRGPQQIIFEEAKPSEAELRNVTQEGPKIPVFEPGSVSLEGAETINQNPGKVILTDVPSNDENPGRVTQDAPRVPTVELDKVQLDGADSNLVGSLGKLPLTAPPESTVSPTSSVNLESPPSQLDINSIGNADLQSP